LAKKAWPTATRSLYTIPDAPEPSPYWMSKVKPGWRRAVDELPGW